MWNNFDVNYTMCNVQFTWMIWTKWISGFQLQNVLLVFSLENDDAMWSDASDAITFMLNPYSYYLLFKQLTLESESEGIIKSMRFFNSLETYLMMFLHSLLLNILFFSLLRSLHFNFYIPFLYSNSSSSSSFSIIIIICSTQVKVKILTLDTKICSLF